ncbi:hypothetical protein AB0K05_27335 [Nonomuraea sp. NPDC049486]|uniref:hypothetical protein n=1 Tax=unclassified Nonomuraea TaxID=2593643 RepID=UPI0034275707
MTSIATLTNRLGRDRSEGGAVIIVDAEEDVAPALAAALRYFDADDAHEVVIVLNQGRVLGSLRRFDAYSLPPPIGHEVRSYGAADQSLLPGVARYDMVTLTCPRPGCPTRLGLVLYPAHEPRCPRHPDQVLVS